MDYSYIFRSARAKPETFADFGFVPQENVADESSNGRVGHTGRDNDIMHDLAGNSRFARGSAYTCTKTLPDSAFYVVLTISCSHISSAAHNESNNPYDTGAAHNAPSGETCAPACGGDRSHSNFANSRDFDTLTASVYDAATGDKYALFEVPAAHGSFVVQIREQVLSIIEDFRSCCFETTDLKERYVAFLKTRFGVAPEFPWADTPDCCVFRCKNNKWFALLMQVKYKQLGFSGTENNEEAVWAVNMKAAHDEIPSLIDKKSVFPAWHMNKKHWITVLLSAVTDFERLCTLTEQSYKLVSSKR